jgi:peptidoglycan pentaglycine glycine transferase (the first glycine)
MDVEVCTHNDHKLWDEYVSSSPYGHYMQSFAWGLLQRYIGWETTFLRFREKHSIMGCLLLLSRKLPLLGRKIFYAPRGPVLTCCDNAGLESILAVLMETVRYNNGIFVRCDPYIPEGDMMHGSQNNIRLHKLPRDWSYWNAPKLVLWLDLTDDEDTLLKNMTTTCRSEIRVGYKKGVIFEVGGQDDLYEFYKLMRTTGRHKSIAVHNADFYRHLYDTLNLSGKVGLFLGRYGDKTIAAAMSFCYGNKAWLLYAASDRDYNKLRANRTLQWEMIKWARRQGCVRYDFRGTATADPPSTKDPGYGVYEFKKSFGPKYTRLEGYYDLVACPILYRLFRHAEERGLPLAFRLKSWLDERQHKY